jgi:phosphoglycolate phosphatase
LVDSAPGIISCYRATLRELGAPQPSNEALRRLIGPPLRTALQALLGDAERADEAVIAYRARYAVEGVLRARVYAGAFELLAAARREGLRAAICTSKLAGFARQIVRHVGLEPDLAGVFGADGEGGVETKDDVMAEALGQMRQGREPVIMLGDRREDMAAARRHGLVAAGALWGYGDRAELVEAGADRLFESAHEVAAALPSLLG